MSANTHRRKRSVDDFDEPLTPTLYSPWIFSENGGIDNTLARSDSFSSDPPPTPKRRIVSTPRSPSMPLQLSPVPVLYPTFMSVFYGGDEHLENDSLQPSPVKKSDNHLGSSTSDPMQFSIFCHASTASLRTDSAESSPSTIASTFDSPIISDPSPSSSPESATSALPISHFDNMLRTQDGDHKSRLGPVLLPLKPSNSSNTSPVEPSQGLRNVKNLSLNMNAALNTRTDTPASNHTSHPFSAPASPVREPLRSARKKPAGLTIKTPGFQPQGFSKAFEVPPTPRSRPNLPSIATTPLLPSRTSLALPSLNILQPLPVPSTPHARGNSQTIPRGFANYGDLSAVAEEHTISEIPKSQEAPERGYTEGPVMIYDSGVYLFLEPTADEARKFDTIINVAKEVKDPFAAEDNTTDSVMKIWRNGEARSNVPEPPSAVTEMSFRSDAAWPLPAPENRRRVTSENVQKMPEYIHVPWDHNSEILEDLHPLCRLIDDRVRQGKRVLIHCQLGVSRSASLIIAYGLYKEYQADFHSMYMTVKERSRWVGPNMSLIYQLTDFRGRIARGEFGENSKPPARWWKHGTPPQELAGQIASQISSPTALRPMPALSNHISTFRSDPFPSQSRHTFTPIENLPPLPDTPGDYGDVMEGVLFQKPLPPLPSTVTPTSVMPPPPLKLSNNFPSKENKKKKIAPRPLPFRERYEMKVPEIPPHRPRMLNLSTLRISQKPLMDLAIKDVPQTPSVFSPRTTSFIAPFGGRTAGDLAFSHKRIPSIQRAVADDSKGRKDGTRPQTMVFPDDPRSPSLPGKPNIIYRSIDELL